jgi:predicted nucleic acid-binding protein
VTTYVDSSALVAVYVPERFSRAARGAVRNVPQVPFTQLHELEVPNAFELLVSRGLISRDECRAIQRQLRDDLESQRLAPVSVDLERVFTSARELSRVYTATFLTRSLDLLHVAAAQLTLCGRFVSADDRQLAVAKAAGFDVIDIKHPGRRPKS